MAWGNEDFGAAKIDDRCAVSMGCPGKFAARMRYWLIVLRPALNSSIAAGATSWRADRWFCDQEVCHVIHYVVCNRLDLTRRSVDLRPHRRSDRRATLLRQSWRWCAHDRWAPGRAMEQTCPSAVDRFQFPLRPLDNVLCRHALDRLRVHVDNDVFREHFSGLLSGGTRIPRRLA